MTDEYIPGKLYRAAKVSFYMDDENKQDQGCYEAGSIFLCLRYDEEESTFLDPVGKILEANNKLLMNWIERVLE